MVNEYNYSMNGVGRADEKVVVEAFFWLLEVVVVNNYLLYSIQTKPLSNHQHRRRFVVAHATCNPSLLEIQNASTEGYIFSK